MSYEAGMKALNLEFSDQVPRTEYSVAGHWELVKVVTGMPVETDEERMAARTEFMKKWDYSINWATCVSRNYMKNGRTTDMGHAEYATNGEDFRDTITNPFTDVEQVWALDPCKEYGEFDKQQLIREFEDKYDQLCSTRICGVNMGGVYITMISGILEILGWDMMLLALGSDEKKFNKLLEGYYEWVKQFYEAFAESKIPVFMCHDDMMWTSGPFAHPDWYRENIFPKVKKMIEPVKAAGKKILFTSDGTYDMFYDDVIGMGVDMVVMEPSNDMELFAKKYGKTHGFIGGCDCRVLLNGSKEDIYKEVKRAMDIGKPYPGYVFCTGNHIPSNTPVDNCLYYQDAYLELRKR